MEGDLLIFYEGAFAAAALGTVVLVGRFRTAESASRLRAREISRRTLRAEHDIRRRLSESLHDGPVQELISLDMMLAAATHGRRAGRRGRGASELIEEARAVAIRNVNELRDEMLDLGPYAYEEFSFELGGRALPRGLAAPLRPRRSTLDAERPGPALRGRGRAVSHHPGGGGERRPPRHGASG